MNQKLNKFIDFLSETLATRKGLLLMIAILLVGLNFVLQLFPGAGWLAQSDLFLHLGVVLGLVGVMIAWAL
jgi:pilus assembly protein TadC